MGITVSVLTGGAAGRKLRLMNGQTARFGKTEWADYAFPDDDSMGDIHFAIECTGGKCHLRDLGSDSGTRVGDSQIVEAQLHSGDEFTAGRTVFCITVDGEAAPDRIKPTSPMTNAEPAAASVSPVASPKSLIEICEFLEFDAAVCELAKEQNTEPSEFAKLLADQRQFVPALRLTAHQLSQRQAVWWGSLCTRERIADQLRVEDFAALDAADQWVKTGDESDRRKAHDAAEATNFETAAAWIAMAAFWAEGSLAAAELPEVAPAERLTGQAITGALLMVAAKAPPGQADMEYERFIALADEVVTGKRPALEASSDP